VTSWLCSVVTPARAARRRCETRRPREPRCGLVCLLCRARVCAAHVCSVCSTCVCCTWVCAARLCAARVCDCRCRNADDGRQDKATACGHDACEEPESVLPGHSEHGVEAARSSWSAACAAVRDTILHTTHDTTRHDTTPLCSSLLALLLQRRLIVLHVSPLQQIRPRTGRCRLPPSCVWRLGR
jgi:hypothetical protein